MNSTAVAAETRPDRRPKRGFTGVMTRAYGARNYDATVLEVIELAPHFRRVRFSAPAFMPEIVPAPTAFVRLWVPDPDDPDTEQQRGYTLTELDQEAGTFALDFVLHTPAGPASAWAERAEPGMTIALTTLGSTRFDIPVEVPEGYLLLGDSASIPAINSILAVIPADVAVEVYLEQHDERDLLIPLGTHPRATVHWVPRRGEESLAAAIEARDWSNWYAWAAPESGSLKLLRARLREEFGFPKSEVHAQAYWYEGRAFGTQRAKSTAGEAVRMQTSSDATAAPAAASDSAPTTAPPQGRWKARGAGTLLAPLKTTLVLAGAAQALVTLLQLAPFVLLAELARLLVTGAPAAALWTVGIWAVALMGAGVLLSSALLLWLHLVDANAGRDLRLRLLNTLARVPLGWFDARGSGRIKQLVQDDTLALHYLVTHAVPDAVAAVIAPVAVLTYLFLVDWRIALLLLLPVVIYIVAMVIMVVYSGPRTGQAMAWAEQMNVEAGAYLEGQPVVRVFGGAAASRFRAQLGEYIRFLGDWQRPLSGHKVFIDLVTRPATFLLLICALGTLLVTAGTMDPVTLLPFLLLGTTFGARLLGVGYGLSGLRAGLLAARRIQNALDVEALEQRPATQAPAPTVRGEVTFDGVGFAYRPGVPVLHDVTLTLPAGSVTALVGPSGSGKSTLAALLARFYDVTGGAIRIDGTDIREFRADELYTRVCFVFQQTQLVHGTVRDNIALAVPDATREQVEDAARAAQLHERILRLPQGYDTVLGPDAALSGGERQRLTIARALLADTPVLVLDEATAFADPESEYLVQQALDRLTAGRTVLVIAHRLHTITGVDQIVVLDEGRVAQTGTHDELLAQPGRYRALWEAGHAARATSTAERAR